VATSALAIISEFLFVVGVRQLLLFGLPAVLRPGGCCCRECVRCQFAMPRVSCSTRAVSPTVSRPLPSASPFETSLALREWAESYRLDLISEAVEWVASVTLGLAS